MLYYFQGESLVLKNEDIVLLSWSETKMYFWNCFKRACEGASKRVVSYTKFTELWKQFHPNVVVARPTSDLCFTCQQNSSKLLRAANLPVAYKSECVRTQQDHLNSVQTERELYRKACDDSKRGFNALEDSIDIDERHDPCSLDTTMYYSFDFTQQVNYQSNPM